MIVKELTRTDFKETMVLKADQERVKTLIRDTVTLLCKNGLEFRDKFSLEALIGVTLDEGEVVLLSINELVQADGYAQRSPAETSPAHTSPRKRRKRSRSGGQVKAEVSESDGGEELVFVKEELVADQTWPEVSTEYADPVAEASSAAGIPGTSFSSAMVDMNLLESNQQQTEWVSQGSDGSYGNTATTTVTMASAGQQGTMATTGSQDDMTGQLSGDPLDQQQQMASYFCRLCGQMFTCKSSLQRHLNWHDGKYQHKCTICGKGFMNMNDLVGHMSWHTGVKQFKCTLCPREYRYKQHLQSHMSKEHK